MCQKGIVDMGSALQRIEVLLVGLVLLISGTVVVGFMLLRPASPTTYVQATPQAIVTSGAVRPTSAPATASSSTAATGPTAAPVATAALAATSAPRATAISTATMAPPATAVPPTTSAPVPTLAVPLIVKTIWPWLLLAVGLGGGAIVLLRMRKRRMTYTNQSAGQLLPAADDLTRATNVRIRRGLAEQGVLTAELAAAAGMDLKQPHKHPSLQLPRPQLPHLTMLRLTLPRVQLPALRMPRVNWPKLCLRRRQRPRTIDRAPVSAASVSLATAAAALDAAPDSAERAAAPRGVLAAQAIDLPAVELSVAPDAYADETDAWTAEDGALAVAGVLADIWAAAELRSPVLALDTASTEGNGQVIVTLDQHPDEEQRLADLPERIVTQRPAWRASWRRMGGLRTAPALVVDVVTNSTRPPSGGPLLVPILAHGRSGKTTRFYPLASWQHLGLYGASALAALHAILGSLLYNQPPSNLALAIIDKEEITSLYRDEAHLVPLPGAMRESVEILAQAIKRGTRGAVRPLVLVIVEPDDTLLNLLTGIAARLRAKPNTPVHLLIVQERLSIAGRELYAMLPGLITSGGRGLAALLPGQGDWPKRGAARLIGRGMRLDGRAISMDESDITAMISHLRGKPADLPPVLWDAPAPNDWTPATAFADVVPSGDSARMLVTEQPPATPDLEDAALDGNRNRNGDNHAERERASTEDSTPQRRVIRAIVAARQRLIDAHDSPLAATRAGQHPRFSDVGAAVPAISGAEVDQALVNAPVVAEQEFVAAAEPPFVADSQMALLMSGSADATLSVAPVTGEAVADPTDQAAAHLMPSADVEAAHGALAPATQEGGSGDTAGSISPASSAEQAPADVQRSRRAALLRAANDSGRQDAPPLQAIQPRRNEPAADEQPILIGRAIERPPSDRPPETQPIAEPNNGWPIGPAPLGRVAMAELMARVASSPTIIAGQANEVGVTKNRLVDLLKGANKAQAKELAEWLMAWLELAGLLAEPTRPGRLRHPRALVTTNLAEIAEKLSATPCPDKAAVKALWALSNEGRD